MGKFNEGRKMISSLSVLTKDGRKEQHSVLLNKKERDRGGNTLRGAHYGAPQET